MKRITSLLLLSALSLYATDIYATFNVTAQKEATLAFTSGGTVASIKVEIGSKVKKGQVLASLENSEQIALLKLAENDLVNAQTQTKEDSNSYDRYYKVKDIMDAEKFEKITFAKDRSIINAQKAKHNVDLRQAQLDKLTLTAPFDGVITYKYKEVGDAVAGVQPQAFFQIMDISQVKLLLSFDEKYANTVKVGDVFEYRVDGVAAPQHASIAKIYPSIDSKTRKIQAEILTQNLMPGLFGAGTIKAD